MRAVAFRPVLVLVAVGLAAAVAQAVTLSGITDRATWKRQCLANLMAIAAEKDAAMKDAAGKAAAEKDAAEKAAAEKDAARKEARTTQVAPKLKAAKVVEASKTTARAKAVLPTPLTPQLGCPFETVYFCPAGGTYTNQPPGVNPTCSVRGHVLPPDWNVALR